MSSQGFQEVFIDSSAHASHVMQSDLSVSLALGILYRDNRFQVLYINYYFSMRSERHNIIHMKDDRGCRSGGG